MYVKRLPPTRSLVAADVYGGRHLLYEAVIAVYFYPSVTQYPLEDGSVAGLCVAAAFLSAFLDALTVVAVVISVAVGFYGIYHRVASSRGEENDMLDDSHIDPHYKTVLEQFRGFLRSLMMHAGVGTALGGVMTMVGEPQNLIIAKAAGWHFGDFFCGCRLSPSRYWYVDC